LCTLQCCFQQRQTRAAHTFRSLLSQLRFEQTVCASPCETSTSRASIGYCPRDRITEAANALRRMRDPADDSASREKMRLLRYSDCVTGNPADNLFEELYETTVRDLLRDRPDLVGISILNGQQIIPGLTLARRCREAGLTVVLGGTVYAKFHDQLSTRKLFFDTFCDGLVLNEGETAMRELVEAVTAGRGPRSWGTIPNMVSLNANGELISGPVHAEDIRLLPTPDFDGLPLASYLNPVPVLPILTGKGCYFNRCKLPCRAGVSFHAPPTQLSA